MGGSGGKPGCIHYIRYKDAGSRGGWGKLAPIKILHPSLKYAVLALNFSKKQKKEDIHIYREKRVNLNILKEKTGHIPYLNDLL